MPNLELEQIVLDSRKVHKDALGEPVLPHGREWKIKLSIATGTREFSIHGIVSDPARMVNAVENLALTIGGMLNRILAVPELAAQLMGNRGGSGETVSPYDLPAHSDHP